MTKTISTNVTNFISANITSTVSKSKTKWILYFVHGFISGHITIYSRYHYTKQAQTKNPWCTNNIKKENNEFKKIISQISRVIVLMLQLILKILILIIFCWIKNHTKIFLFMKFHTKLLLLQNLMHIISHKVGGLLELMMELNV